MIVWRRLSLQWCPWRIVLATLKNVQRSTTCSTSKFWLLTNFQPFNRISQIKFQQVQLFSLDSEKTNSTRYHFKLINSLRLVSRNQIGFCTVLKLNTENMIINKVVNFFSRYLLKVLWYFLWVVSFLSTLHVWKIREKWVVKIIRKLLRKVLIPNYSTQLYFPFVIVLSHRSI